MQIKLKLKVSPDTIRLIRGSIGVRKLDLERRISLRLLTGIERAAIEAQITELNNVLHQMDEQQALSIYTPSNTPPRR